MNLLSKKIKPTSKNKHYCSTLYWSLSTSKNVLYERKTKVYLCSNWQIFYIFFFKLHETFLESVMHWMIKASSSLKLFFNSKIGHGNEKINNYYIINC